MDLDKVIEKMSFYGKDFPLIIVSIEKNKLFYLLDNKVIEYIISTSLKRPSCIKDSYGTPTGWHEVCEKYGQDAEIGTVFVGRKPIGKKYWEKLPEELNKKNLITTRILRLSGLEDGKNKGICLASGLCCDSYERYVYIHGTNFEDQIGQPLSHGCILMKNHDIVELFEKVSIGCGVCIV